MSLLMKGVGTTTSLGIKIPAEVHLIGDGRPAVGIIYLYTYEPFGDGVVIDFNYWGKLNNKAYLTKKDGTPLYFYIEGDETLTKIYVYPLYNDNEDLILYLNNPTGAGMRNKYYDPDIFDKISPFSSILQAQGSTITTVPLWTKDTLELGEGVEIISLPQWEMTSTLTAWGDAIVSS